MSQKWLWAWLGILAAGLVLGTSAGHADVVHLTDGTTKEGKVIEESDDEIVLEMNIRGIKASLHILKKEIESIERETSWRETLDDREKKLEAEDAEGWYKLGMQYKEHGLPDDAKRCFEKVLKANPQHEEAAKELGFVSTGGEFADVEGTIRKGEDLVEAKEYAKAEEKLKPLLDFPVTKVNSVQRKDILGLLITCYERTAQWAKAQDAYEQFLRCATVDKSEVAIIRVKQRVLRENPDGMIDLAEYDAKSKKAQSVLPKLEDFAKIPGAALKAGGDLLTGKGGKSGKGRKGQEEPKYAKGGKQPLSDPKVMDTVIRAEAEGILLEAQHKVEKADAQAVSDKMWQYTPFPIILNLASRPKQVALRSSPAEKLYEEAADVAEDADYLVPGISAALRLKIAQKRAALWDEFIKKTREDMESHPYYMAPPPASATPAQAQQILQQQNQRLSTMNVTMDEAEKYLEIVKRLDALQARKLEVLQPFSDQALAQVEKVQKEREQINEIREKAQKIDELAQALKESEKLEALVAECNVKARANLPQNFEYGYEKFQDADGLYHFKDDGRKWRAQVDLCVSYCEKAMEAARKRIALLRKFPDRPQFIRDIESMKTVIVQVYQMEQNVLMDRGRLGRTVRPY